MIDKIFKPLHYLIINHPEKRWFDLYLPILFAFLTIIIICLLPKQIVILGKDGLINLINGMLQILSGFFIAAMAAVATFQRAGMDDVMDGVPPKIHGQALTRRQFLSYLFGYLAFSSIFTYFAGGFIQLCAGAIYFTPLSKVALIKIPLLFIYLTVIFNIILTTVLGMHFLIDKINRPQTTLVVKDKDEDS